MPGAAPPKPWACAGGSILNLTSHPSATACAALPLLLLLLLPPLLLPTPTAGLLLLPPLLLPPSPLLPPPPLLPSPLLPPPPPSGPGLAQLGGGGPRGTARLTTPAGCTRDGLVHPPSTRLWGPPPAPAPWLPSAPTPGAAVPWALLLHGTCPPSAARSSQAWKVLRLRLATPTCGHRMQQALRRLRPQSRSATAMRGAGIDARPVPGHRQERGR